MEEVAPSVAELLTRDHRRLDELLGRFLAAADRESAVTAIGDFDEALRAHTRLEEEHLFPFVPGGKLVSSPDETARDRLFRELSLEHVQIRELSGMIVRRLSQNEDAGAAFALTGSLARRWDAHTAREEKAYAVAVERLGADAELELRRRLGDSNPDRATSR